MAKKLVFGHLQHVPNSWIDAQNRTKDDNFTQNRVVIREKLVFLRPIGELCQREQ